MTTYLRYSPSIEEIASDEAETFAKIAESFRETGEKVAKQEGRRMRVSHAKPTALLDGELIIEGGLAPELRQGLAAQPGRYAALVRFAQGPGEQLADKVSTHRGMSIKLKGIDAESIPQAAEPKTQDFLLEGSGRSFINATAKGFLANLKGGVSHAPSMPDAVKQAVSTIARGTEAALETVGLESKTLAFFGHPPLHPLAEPYFSQAPMRWGDYVAKVGFFPTTSTLNSLAEEKIDTNDDFNAFRTAMITHFARAGATFELRVQLATDLETTPIEDAAAEWSQDETPYRVVGQLILPARPGLDVGAGHDVRDDVFPPCQ